MTRHAAAPGVGWVLDDDGQAVVIAPAGTGERVVLQGTAVDVWLLVAAGEDDERVVGDLQARYDGDLESIATASTDLVAALVARGLLVELATGDAP